MSKELLGLYTWEFGPATILGLAAAVKVFGRDEPVVRLQALHGAHLLAPERPRFGECETWRFTQSGRIGLCVRRKGHEPKDAHKTLMLSLEDSRAITEAVRRVVEPLPIPEV